MLSIREAAALSGKSPRTIREHARTGRISAQRVGGRWVVSRAELLDAPAGSEARDRRRAEVDRLREHVDSALDEARPGGRGFYSVRDVKSFEVMSTVRDELERIDAPAATQAAALAALRCAMHQLAEGFHQYQPALKVARFLEARGRCCEAIAELTHFGRRQGHEPSLERAARLEREALGAMRGLLRRAERRQAEGA